jgi:predicted transposase YbfD/YdcC
MSNCITDSFSMIKDPRLERKKLHSLTDILVLTICAMLSGAEGYTAIEAFGHNKTQWLKSFLPLKNGIPSHDCLRYVLTRLPPEQLQLSFVQWVKSFKEKNPEFIAIDGKTSKGSQSKCKGLSGLHMVTAWATANKLVLAQEATKEKSNEITAIPSLLKLLEIKGSIVTIDAMGCQANIAKQVIELNGDYVLGLKGNQGLLHKGVKAYFLKAQESGFKNTPYSFYEESAKEHGRHEIRKYWILKAPNTLHRFEKWEGLNSIGMVQRISTIGDKQTTDTRYFISSTDINAKLFGNAVRSHWGIENSLHWCLDVTFREDDSRIRTGNAPAVMSMIRHICMNLLKKESSKLSIKQKRLNTAWNDSFRYKVLFGGDF